MKTIKPRMYGAGLSNLEVDALYEQYARLLLLSIGAQPDNEVEDHFQQVVRGEASPNSHLELAWVKFHAYKLYEYAKSCEQKLGVTDPKTLTAYKTAGAAGSPSAQRWLAARSEPRQNYWRNTIWDCHFPVGAVYGSSGHYSEL